MDLKKVKPGDPLQFASEVYNALVDTAITVRQSGRSGSPGSRALQRNGTAILVQNKTTTTQPQFACLQLSKPLVLPANSENDFAFSPRISMEGIIPTTANLPWVILQQALQKDEIGEAIVAGCTIAKINLLHTDDLFVDSASGTTVAASSTKGAARIAWVAGGAGTATATGNQYAVIIIGAGGGGGVPDPTLQGQVLQAVSDNQWGAQFPVLHQAD